MKSLKQYIKEHLLVENFGEFKGAQEVVNKILNSIKENECKTEIKIDVSEFGLLYSTIILKINVVNYEILRGYYDANKSNFKDNTIYITIEFDKIYVNELKKIIIHELTHANCDFNLHKIGKSINSLLLSKHFKNETDNKKMYNASSNVINTKFENIANKIIYFLNNSERNAYLSRLKSDVFDILDKHKIDVRSSDGYEKLIKEIKNIPSLKEIFSIGEYIETLDDDKTNYLIRKYNNLYKINSNNYTKIKSENIIKDVEDSWNKFLKKFNEYVPKICAEYYDESIK